MAIGVGLGALVLFLIAVVPIFRNVTTVQGKIKSKSTELDNLTSKVTILSQLDPNVLQERVTILDGALPPKKDILLYLTSIEGLSRELNLNFGSLSLTPGELNSATQSAQKSSKAIGLQSLDTEIKMQGSQQSIYSFLRLIESVLPLMQIKDVKVSIMGNDQLSLALTLGMLWAEPTVTDIKGEVTLFGTVEDKYFEQLSQYRRFDTVISNPVETQIKKDLFAPIPKNIVATPSPTPSTEPAETILQP
jgi:hypothetical protein